LYDCRKDLGETVNPAGTEPEKRKELSGLWTEWADEIVAIEPEPDHVRWAAPEPRGHLRGCTSKWSKRSA